MNYWMALRAKVRRESEVGCLCVHGLLPFLNIHGSLPTLMGGRRIQSRGEFRYPPTLASGRCTCKPAALPHPKRWDGMQPPVGRDIDSPGRAIFRGTCMYLTSSLSDRLQGTNGLVAWHPTSRSCSCPYSDHFPAFAASLSGQPCVHMHPCRDGNTNPAQEGRDGYRLSFCPGSACSRHSTQHQASCGVRRPQGSEGGIGR